ncbi:MAG: hypothetical protein ACYS76_13190 [Planctomycetota bacterium]
MRAILKRFLVVVVFGAAFAYIEAAVVVYLRTIFHPEGFSFPLKEFGSDPRWEQLLLTEVGREAATLALILTGAWLCGRNLRERFAFFLAIFAVWDIFYYGWLKVLIGWPEWIMDWDILFLIPMTWASPVLAPVLVSLVLIVFSLVILYRSAVNRALKVTLADWVGFILAGLIVVLSFCRAGRYVGEPDFQSHFSWALFGLGSVFAIGLFLKCVLRTEKRFAEP